MIDLSPDDFEIVMGILREHFPECEIRFFGSRVTGAARKFSDLDIAIIGDDRLPLGIIGAAREEFEESNLPFRVEILDWHRVSEEFRDIIVRESVIVQERNRR